MRRICLKLLPAILIAAGLSLGSLAAWWPFPTEPIHPQGYFPELKAGGRAVDCGAVSLFIICHLSGKNHTLEELRDLTKTSSIGTDMLELKLTGAALGYQVEAGECSFAKLNASVARRGQYAVIHSSEGHFAAVVAAPTGLTVRIADPAFGVQDLTETELREGVGWDGAVLLLKDAEASGGGHP